MAVCCYLFWGRCLFPCLRCLYFGAWQAIFVEYIFLCFVRISCHWPPAPSRRPPTRRCPARRCRAKSLAASVGQSVLCMCLFPRILLAVCRSFFFSSYFYIVFAVFHLICVVYCNKCLTILSFLVYNNVFLALYCSLSGAVHLSLTGGNFNRIYFKASYNLPFSLYSPFTEQRRTLGGALRVSAPSCLLKRRNIFYKSQVFSHPSYYKYTCAPLSNLPSCAPVHKVFSD